MERERQAGPVAALEGPGDAGAETARMSALAPGADGDARQRLVAGLATLDLGTPRATADHLHGLLSSGTLEGVRAKDGRSARAVAVERLRALGYPYALEVSPEDYAHWQAERPGEAADGRGLAVLLVSVASALALWGVEAPPHGAGRAVVLGIIGVTVLSTLRPFAAGRLRRLVFGLGVLACVLALGTGPAMLLPGVAALVAARLLGPGGLRGAPPAPPP